jgi:hypothetical protein
MNWKHPRRCLALLLMLCALIAGCDTTNKDWRAAKSAQSVVAYQAFMAQHPRSTFVGQATAAIDSLRWNEAKRVHTVVSVTGFIEAYPDSKYRDVAGRELEEIDWSIASGSPSRDQLMAFINKYPNSIHDEQARDGIWELEWPPVTVDHIGAVLVWSKGEAILHLNGGSASGPYSQISTNGILFDEMTITSTVVGGGGAARHGDAREVESGFIFIWRDFSARELPKVQKLGLRTGVAYVKTDSGFSFVRKVDLQKSDKELWAAFGL